MVFYETNRKDKGKPINLLTSGETATEINYGKLKQILDLKKLDPAFLIRGGLKFRGSTLYFFGWFIFETKAKQIFLMLSF